MEDTIGEELGQNQTANLAGADVDDDGCEGVKMREGGMVGLAGAATEVSVGSCTPTWAHLGYNFECNKHQINL